MSFLTEGKRDHLGKAKHEDMMERTSERKL